MSDYNLLRLAHLNAFIQRDLHNQAVLLEKVSDPRTASLADIISFTAVSASLKQYQTEKEELTRLFKQQLYGHNS